MQISKFSRDNRSPIPKNGCVSKMMSGNKGRDTKPEIQVRKALWQNSLRGYRLYYKKVPGCPDIVYVSKKIAIFIHGCFWHRYPYCDLPEPKNNSPFWREKFKKNKSRDNRKINELRNSGWSVITIWECKIKKCLKDQIKRVQKIYEANSN